jgi:hypothetical protein
MNPVTDQARGDAETLPHAHRVLRDPVTGAMEDPDPLQRHVDPTPRRRLPCRRQHLQVLPASQVGVEPRLVHDRRNPRQRDIPMLWNHVAEQ